MSKMKNYSVQVDVTMSIFIDVESDKETENEIEEDIKKKVKNMEFTPSDLRHSWFVEADVVDYEEENLNNFNPFN